jgi:hypothetical protein
MSTRLCQRAFHVFLSSGCVEVYIVNPEGGPPKRLFRQTDIRCFAVLVEGWPLDLFQQRRIGKPVAEIAAAWLAPLPTGPLNLPPDLPDIGVVFVYRPLARNSGIRRLSRLQCSTNASETIYQLSRVMTLGLASGDYLCFSACIWVAFTADVEGESGDESCATGIDVVNCFRRAA